MGTRRGSGSPGQAPSEPSGARDVPDGLTNCRRSAPLPELSAAQEPPARCLAATEGLLCVRTHVAASRPAPPHLPRAAALPGAPETSWLPARRAVTLRCERLASGRPSPRAPRKLPPPDPARGLPHARCPPARAQPCAGRGGARGGVRLGESRVKPETGPTLGRGRGRGTEWGVPRRGAAGRGGAGQGRGPEGGDAARRAAGKGRGGARQGARRGARRGQGARAWCWVSGRWEYRAGGPWRQSVGRTSRRCWGAPMCHRAKGCSVGRDSVRDASTCVGEIPLAESPAVTPSPPFEHLFHLCDLTSS